jgi:hypothetical protein
MGSSRKIRGYGIRINAKIDIVLEPVPGTYGLIGRGIEPDPGIRIDGECSGLVIGLVVSPGNYFGCIIRRLRRFLYPLTVSWFRGSKFANTNVIKIYRI